MIYIVVYKEVSLALTLDSAHTKIWLQDLHPNIQGKPSFTCKWVVQPTAHIATFVLILCSRWHAIRHHSPTPS